MFFLTRHGGDLYYVSMMDGGFYKFVDGVADEKVVDSQVYYPSISGSDVYFVNAMDYGVYKASLNKKDAAPEKVLDNAYFAVTEGGYIYYVSKDDELLYRASISDPAKVEQVTKTKPVYINVTGGYVYYMDYETDSCIYKMKADGTGEAEKLADVSAGYVNVKDGWVYFTDTTGTSSGSYPLKRVSVNGGEVEEISQEPAYNTQIIGKRVYYMTMGTYGETMWVSINLDGSDRQTLESTSSTPQTFTMDDLVGDESSPAPDATQAPQENADGGAEATPAA